MYRALYRKYRPSVFSDVSGQDHITSVLRYQVENGRTSHAYLFCGSRGTGKTTCAKILSKAVNCLSPVNGDPCGICENCLAIEKGTASDVLEMDAASNTGVDYIRDIKDAVMYAPTMLKNRVYIIDEVHMLSDGAFNALLKTLEEPPSNVVFILATTEVQKIPATILSRCQRFEFRRIAGNVIADRLRYIAQNEGIDLEEDAARLIARNAQGGMRDAISLLEICGSEGKKVNASMVERLSGGAGRKTVEDTVKALSERKIPELFSIIERLYESSGDLGSFWQELTSFYRDMIVCKTVKGVNTEELRKNILDLTQNEFQTLEKLSEEFRYETLIYHFKVLDESYDAVCGKRGTSGRVAAEMALVRMASDCTDGSTEAILERISRLECLLKSGVVLTDGESETSKRLSNVSSDGVQTIHGDVDSKISVDGGSEKSGKTEVEKKELVDFVEILRDYMNVEPGTASFLVNSKAYFTTDGTVSVCVGDNFAVRMLNNRGAGEKLSAILRQTQGIDAKINFVCESTKKSERDLMDELS